MKHSFLALLLLANCAPFADAPSDTTDSATTSPATNKKTSEPSSSDSSSDPVFTPASSTNQASTSSASTAAAEPALWPVVAKKVAIPVCWDSSIPSDLRGNVEQMVRAQWNTLSALSFTGWSDCADGDLSNVRLMGTSGPSSASGLGFVVGAQVLLNTNGKSDQLVTDALHELGHIAGLGHEGFSADDSADRVTCNTLISTEGIANDLPVVPPADRDVPDPQGSIMSRCRLDGGDMISQADSDAISRLYNLPIVDWTDIGDDDNF